MCTNCTTSGTYQPNFGGTNCPNCPTGTYQTGVMQAVCISCKEGKFNGLTGRTAEAACLDCALGTFALYAASACSRCEIGEYAGTTGMSACAQCEEGKYQTGRGLAFCLSCEGGRFQPSTAQTTCLPCPIGTYQEDQQQTECLPCPPGSQQNRTGQMLCHPCIPGSVAPSPGTGVCAMCNAGKAQALHGQTECPTCERGKHQPARNATTCLDCLPGSINAWNASQWDAMGAAPNCSLCLVGTYVARAGQTACLDCEENRFQNATGRSTCQNCSLGLFSGIRQSACSNCSAGNYQGPASLCVPCEIGKYQEGRGRTTCRLCPAGRFSQQNMSDSLDDCLRCEAGSFAQDAGSSTCRECTAGTFQTSLGSTACSKCSSGTYTSVIGANSGCLGCGAGLYQASNGSTVCKECTPCAGTGFRWAGCNGTHDAECRNCSVCSGGREVVRACTNSADTLCGEEGQCWPNRTSLMTVYPWVLADRRYRCAAGEYLYGFQAVRGEPGTVERVCRRCPEGWVGLNAMFCERCGDLQEPYYVDRSTCVCKAPAIMNATGGCECPGGYGLFNGSCLPCPRDTYGTRGACYPCGAGNTTSRTGATACEPCPDGSYRTSGSVGEGCSTCAIAGWFAPDPAQGVCVRCNTTCALEGWRWKGTCPGDASGNFSVCEPCPGGVPANGRWVNVSADPVMRRRALEECVYECDAGFYHNGEGECMECNSTRVCEPGRRLTACTPWADSHCDTECVDEQKPQLYSHWVAGSNACAWACDEGKTLAVTDYVIFTLRECV